MPLFRKWKYKDAIWGIWQVVETEEELKSFFSGIPFVEEELAAYKSVSRRMEYLAVRVLLKEMAGACYKILHKPSGKPYIGGSDVRITISHTKGYVAIGLHPSQEPGIDIEYYSERVSRVVSRFVRDDEKDYIQQGDVEGVFAGKELVYKLLLLWSAKETLYKVIDRREVDFKEHLRIYPFSFDMDDALVKWGGMVAQEYKSEARKMFNMEYMVHDDFVCTYCVAD